MTTPRSSNLRAVGLALLAFATFSTHDVIVKWLGGAYSPIQIVFFSVMFGFPIVTLMLLRDATERNLIPLHPWWTALRTGAAVVTGVSAFYAFSVLPLTQAYAIIFAAPLLITIFSIPILGERVGWRRWAAVLVGLIGVLVVLRPGSAALGLGHGAALLCAVGGALASVIVRKIGREERSVVLLIYPMMANFILMGALLPLVYQPLPGAQLGGLFVIAVFAFIGTTCLIAAYKLGEAVIVAPMQYSQLLWATIYGLVFFDEVPDLMTGIGAGIIIASGVYIVLREGRGGTSETTPVLRTRSRVGLPAALRVSSLIRVRGGVPQHAPDAPSPALDRPQRKGLRGLPGRT